MMNLPGIQEAVSILREAARKKRLIAFCGNGGSASQCSHFVGELVGRFEGITKPIRAISLAADMALLTALGNDYGFENVFAVQVEALLDAGDILVVLSTSGTSENCVRASEKAKEKGVTVIALTGHDGGKLKALADVLIAVPSIETAYIQEQHLAIGHFLCREVKLGS